MGLGHDFQGRKAAKPRCHSVASDMVGPGQDYMIDLIDLHVCLQEVSASCIGRSLVL